MAARRCPCVSAPSSAPRQLDRELEEELQFHADETARRLIARGAAPAEARAAARSALSEIELCKEECRDARGVRLLHETGQDARFAWRLLRRSPGFCASAIGMLALALGASATVFAFASTLLFRPLPYGTPADRLALVWERFDRQALERIPFSAPEVIDLRAGLENFDDAAAFRHTEFNLADGTEPERVHGAAVSWNLFSVLAAPPLMGRTFVADDENETGPPVVVISERLWQRHYASDPGIIGREILLSGRAYRVVGVMPWPFRFPLPLFNVRGPMPSTAEIWKPIKTDERLGGGRSSRVYGVIARLRSGASAASAAEDLERLTARWEEKFPGAYHERGFHIEARPLRAEVVGPARGAVLVAVGAVLALLLIAVANLIAWQLARAGAREGELAVRVALGAGPTRLVRQLATEGMLLAMLGAGGGLLVAAGAIAFCRGAAGGGIPLLGDVQLDGQLLLCLCVLAGATGLLLGGLPAWRIVPQTRADNLRTGMPAATNARRWARLRDALVIGETALAFVLLVSAGLLAKSFLRLHQVSLGFNPDSVLTAEVSLPAVKYPSPLAAADFFSGASAKVAALPGVSSVAFTSILPLSGINHDRSFTIEGAAGNGSVPDEEVRAVTPDYFAVMQIPLLRGRAFAATDRAEGAPVAIINQALAQRYWPDRDALGQRLRFNEAEDTPWMEVVGIVGDIRQRSVLEAGQPELYRPHAQMPSYLMTMVARTKRPAAEFAAPLRAAVQSIDPEQAVANLRPMRSVIAESIAPHRFAVVLVSLFAGAAVVLERCRCLRRDLAMSLRNANASWPCASRSGRNGAPSSPSSFAKARSCSAAACSSVCRSRFSRVTCCDRSCTT